MREHGPEGSERLDPVPMQAGLLIDEVAAVLRPVAEKRGIRVEVEASPQVPGWLLCDPVRLRQIVTEILGAAIGEAGPGMITIRIGYVFRIAQLTITVEGGTADPSEKARRLAAVMGGRVTAEGAAGRCRVVVAVTAPRADAPVAGGREAPAVQRPLSVLLVEDNRTNQMVIAAMLQRGGHHLSVAANGEEAVEAVRSGSFDVILMDVEMPVMDGPAAVRAIRAMDGEASGLPVIALTAHAMPGDRERYIALGMSDYLAKPVSPKALAAALRRATGAAG